MLAKIEMTAAIADDAVDVDGVAFEGDGEPEEGGDADAKQVCQQEVGGVAGLVSVLEMANRPLVEEPPEYPCQE
jgi:hypothetical protein